jgi:transcriptional regulator with XRE-family HTH domain
MSFEGAGKIPAAAWEAPRLINLRRQLGVSQETLARNIHVRISTLKLWESGRGRATPWAIPSLNKLEKRLGKSVEILAARKKGARIPDPITIDQTPSRQSPSPTARNRKLRRRKRIAVTGLGSPMLLASAADRMAQARIDTMKRLLSAAR